MQVTANSSILSILYKALIIVIGLTPLPAWSALCDPYCHHFEEIIVTAKKREENLQDVPTSITAFATDTINDIGLTNSNDLGQFIPGVEIRAVSGNEMAKTWIRGSGSVDFNANANPTVGVYLDEVYLPNQFQHTTQIFDLQRIEALRGPQGTLYGRNVTAGAINYITARPRQEFSGYLTGSAGNYDSYNIRGAMTGGIIDNLAGRVAFIYNYSDGWMKGRGAFPTAVTDDNLNGDDTYSWRSSLLWTPRDNVDVYFNVHGHQDHGDAFNYQMIGTIVPGSQAGFSFTQCDFRQRTDCINPYGYRDPDGVEKNGDPSAGDFDLVGDTDNESIGTILNINWDLENFTITSITAYEKYARSTPNDVDASPYPISHNFFGIKTDGWSQELRFTSNRAGSFDWIVGLYYAEDELTSNNDYVFFAPITTFQELAQEQTSFAVFANAGYQFNELFKLNAGLRYTEDDVEFSHSSIRYSDPATGTINAFAPGDISGTAADLGFDDVGWKVGLDYTPNDNWLLYAAVASGYKSGGVGVGFGDPQEINQFDPEDLLAWEIGFKSELWDGRALLNVSAFYYDYQDLQAFDQTTGPFGQVNILSNAPEAEYYGFEAELLTRPLEGIDVRLGLSHLQTEFEEFLRPTTGLDLAGNENVFSPEWKFTGLARYEWPMNMLVEGVMAVSFNWSWTDSVFHTVENDPRVAASDYWLTGGRVSFTTADDKLEFALWSRNLNDAVYRVQSFDISAAGWIITVPNPPRTFGGEFTLRW